MKLRTNQISPNFTYLCKRNFNSQIAEVLLEIMDFNLNNGGLNELDITREEGVNYNPLACRVCDILINSAKVKINVVIFSAILWLPYKSLGKIAVEEELKKFSNIIDIQSILEILDCLNLSQSNLKNPNFNLISAAYFLDRARHIHQQEDINLWLKLIKESDHYLDSIERENTELYNLILKWKTRSQKLIEKQIQIDKKE